MDQTDAAVKAGIVLGVGPGAIILKRITGWLGWVSYPVGAITGFFLIFLLHILQLNCLVGSLKKGRNLATVMMNIKKIFDIWLHQRKKR